MMNQQMPMVAPQTSPAPSMAGALTPQAAPQAQGHPGGFTGPVMIGDEVVQVQGGAVTYEGQNYIVSDDGRFVIDMQQRLVGLIQNGQFIPPTPEIIDQLKQQGVFGNEQPAGVPPQA